MKIPSILRKSLKEKVSGGFIVARDGTERNRYPTESGAGASDAEKMSVWKTPTVATFSLTRRSGS